MVSLQRGRDIKKLNHIMKLKKKTKTIFTLKTNYIFLIEIDGK